MRSITIFSLLFIAIGLCDAQNQVTEFYSEKNKALQRFASDRDTVQLLEFYNNCLNKYEYQMLKNISFDERDGFELAVLKEQYKIADNFFKYEISTGLNRQSLSYRAKKPYYEKYFSTRGAKEIIEDFEAYEAVFKQGLVLPWVANVNVAVTTDQYARSFFYNQYSWTTGNAYKRFNFLEDSLKETIMYEMMSVTDSLNLASVYQMVSKHGFFSYTKTRGGLGFVLGHLYDNKRLVHKGISAKQYLDSLMIQAIKDGEYPPSEYAYMYDFQSSRDEEVTYGVPIQVGRAVYEFPKKIRDIKNVDQRRAKIFLTPLWVDAALYDLELPEGYVKPE